MRDISIKVQGKNGESRGSDSKRRINFSGWKIASFKIPYDGRERVGMIGIDYNLYLTSGGTLLLIVENWSRMPGGRNYRIFETYNTVEEMETEVIHKNSYRVELPSKLIKRAREALREMGPDTLSVRRQEDWSPRCGLMPETGHAVRVIPEP